MKLLTEMSGEGDDTMLVYNGDIAVSGEDQAEHDAVVAHALVRAQDEWWEQPDIDSQDARDAVEWIGVRADAILREWGFSPAEIARP